MTIRLPILLLAFAASAVAPALAQSDGDRFPQGAERIEQAAEPPAAQLPADEAVPEESREARLDRLFDRLKQAGDSDQAEGIARNIQRELLRSGSPTTDLLMKEASAAIEAKQLAIALDVLDAVTRLSPDYAEGWNRRATVHFMQEDYGRSLADIERALAIEPRHWGAISGLATILKAIEEPEEALQAYDRALLIYPQQKTILKARDKLQSEIGGEDI